MVVTLLNTKHTFKKTIIVFRVPSSQSMDQIDKTSNYQQFSAAIYNNTYCLYLFHNCHNFAEKWQIL